jgi:two-component system, sensor histidine kinase PdtaS
MAGGHSEMSRPNSMTMVKRLPILVLPILLTATLPYPAAAQLRVRMPMDEIRQQLKIKQTDTKKAELLLELGLDYVLKEGSYTNDLDSATLLIKQAEQINESLKDRKIEALAYFVYASVFREGGKIDSGRKYIEKALALYKTLDAPEDMGFAWFEMANYYTDRVEGIGNKRDCFEQATLLFRVAGDKENEAFALKNMADCNLQMEEDTLAVRQLLEALAIYRSIGYKDLQGVYDLLGIISNWMGDYPDAVKFGLEALRTAETRHDTSLQLCTIYNRLGISYGNWGEWDQGIAYYKKAMDIAIKYKDIPAMRTVMLNLCGGLSRQGQWKDAIRYARFTEAAVNGRGDRLDSTYLALTYLDAHTRGGQFDKAKKYAGELISLLRIHPEAARASDLVYAFLFRYYMAVRQYPEAQKNALTYLSLVLPTNRKKNKARAYEMMSGVDSAQGNYVAALSDYKNYKKITDSMLNETTSFQFVEQQVEYNTEQKDNDIILLKQQREIEQAKLTQTRILNMVGAAGVIVLGLLLGLLYNRYRVKQRLNNELEVRQQLISEKGNALEGLLKEKDWLVREIHHRVKNNLQIVMSLLNTQSAYLTDEKALSAIRESQNRVQAIALLHQKLYQSEDLAVIDMPSYVKEVMEYLAENLDARHRIDFEVDVAQVALDVSQAVPLGLIINEAITNSIKYAFPNGNKGYIRVSMETGGDGRMLVTIHDNGIGLPEGYDLLHSPSLGMSLMKGLSKQLDGECNLVNHGGLTIQVGFYPLKIDHNGKEGTDRR